MKISQGITKTPSLGSSTINNTNFDDFNFNGSNIVKKQPSTQIQSNPVRR